jgi:pre-mRNA-processing factor 40
VEPSSLPSNQSSSLVGIIAPSTQDAIANVPPGTPPAAGLSYNGSMQNGGASAAVVTPVTVSTGVSSVASDAVTSRYLQMFSQFPSVLPHII